MLLFCPIFLSIFGAKSDPNNVRDNATNNGNGREETVSDAEDIKKLSSSEAVTNLY